MVMCDPLFSTVKYFVIDIAFCVSNSIVALAVKQYYFIGHYMPSQGKQYCELFGMFSELHKIGGVEYEQDRYLLCFFYFWLPQQHPHPIDKQGFKVSLITW